MIRRKKCNFRKGDIIDVEECHDGRYGAPGEKRQKRVKPTQEQIRIVNAQNKAKRCRQKMLAYFKMGDILATWTYEVENRPPTMQDALKDFQKAMRYVRREFKKRGYEVFWIRNIEKGTKGAWHIHLVINEIGDTVSIIQKAWTKGGTWSIEIKHSKYYDEDFTKLDLYIEVSSKRIKPGKASFCYVLEYISPAGNTYTKSEIGCIEASGNRLVLSAVIRALGHLKPGCGVVIHTDLRYLESALMLGWMQEWKTDGWTRSDGKEIKNRDLWEQIEQQTKIHNLQVKYTCKSPHTAWMQNEMKKTDLEIGQYKEIKGQ